MWKGIRSRSKRDSKRSKEKLRADANDNVDVLQGTDTPAAISKHDLKERWGGSGLSGDLLEFAGDLLDRLVKGPDTATVREEIHTAFQDAMALHGHPDGRQPNLETWENFHQKQAEAQRVGDDEYTPTHPLQRAEAEREDRDDSYCAQATDEDEFDERVQPTKKRKEMGTSRKKRKRRCLGLCSFWSCRLLISIGVLVALAYCVLHFEEVENKIAEIVMNNPLLASRWDSLGGKSIRILVTGKTGTGKSALINGLIGQKVAVEGDTLNPQTSKVQQIKRMVQGVSMSIFDSPGLQDGTEREQEYLEDMQWKCRSVDLVLYAIRMTDQRVHAEDTRAMKKLTTAFGVEFWTRAVFVLTFANEVQDPIDPEDEVKNEAHFKKRLEIWKEFLPEIIEERVNIPAEIARSIPIIPVGYYSIRDLPGQKYWFTQFWLAAVNRMKEAEANGAMYMLEFSKERIKTSDQTTEQDFEKPIYEQPIVYDE